MTAGGAPSTRAIAKVFFTIVAFSAALAFLYWVRSTLLLVFIALFVAVALGPAVDLFGRWLPRSASILLVYVLIGLAVFGVGLLIVPPIVDQVDQLVEDVPGYLGDLRENETFREYDDKYDVTQKLQEQAETLPERLGDAAGALQSVTVTVFSSAVQLVTVLTMAFFLLLDGSRISGFLFRLTGSHEGRARGVARDVYKAVSGYVAGALTIATINGIGAYVMMSILGIPFAVPLAVLSAFLGLIPLVGATIGAVIIGIVSAFTDFPGDTIAWAVYALLYQQAENNLLQPFVYRRTVNVHPLLVIVAILIGASVLGVLGALVAIPIAATIQIVVREWWQMRSGLHAVPDPPPDEPDPPGVPPIDPQPQPA